uniref:Uncharacterized protein n=1 Tax=Arundo donax TaxID=35708 RepID=A0A0A9DD66_ARUDO
MLLSRPALAALQRRFSCSPPLLSLCCATNQPTSHSPSCFPAPHCAPSQIDRRRRPLPDRPPPHLTSGHQRRSRRGWPRQQLIGLAGWFPSVVPLFPLPPSLTFASFLARRCRRLGFLSALSPRRRLKNHVRGRTFLNYLPLGPCVR